MAALAAPSIDARGLTNRVRFLARLLGDTLERFSQNDGLRLCASFSYYATFSIFPLFLLAITVVGFVVGDSDVTRDRLLDAVGAPGSSVRDVLQRTLAAMQASGSARGVSAVIGTITLLFGASGAFTELDAALNRIWCVPERKWAGVRGFLRELFVERLASIAIIAGLALALLASLASSTFLSFVSEKTSHVVGGPIWPAVMRTVESGTSIVLLSCAFAAAFHFIPRARPRLRVVLPGAILTTVLLSALKEAFAAYLSHLTAYSAYGVAGSVLGLVTWIYLTSTIIFAGAQLTRVYAEKIGEARPPTSPDQLRSGCATTPP